ncbi:MAG TPA: hypothetical protein VK249_16650 [Anaerolineales bacterium]|nr:hypothetical protein [Anaerolineales bacterium]
MATDGLVPEAHAIPFDLAKKPIEMDTRASFSSLVQDTSLGVALRKLSH